MMMGSADALPQAPVEKTMFVEDMTDQQLAKAVRIHPGLLNSWGLFNNRGLRLLNGRGLLNSWGLFSNRGSLQNLNSFHEIWNGGYLTASTSRCFESFITEISHVKTNFWLCMYWIITAKILHFDCYFSVKWELIFSF